MNADGGRDTIRSMSASGPAEASASPRPLYSQAYLRYALGLLCVVYIINFVDRQILAILLESIKRDLGLADWQLGLLSGTAFGIFYATLGIPIARLADRFSRKGVIGISLAVWSGMTALCGTASGFATLLVYRVGVGVGEAGGSPPAHSMISDYFPPERRATALAIFSLGVPLGILVGFMAGGWLDQTIGWRNAFLVVGAPGIALSLLVAFTLREPPRGYSEGLESSGDAPSAAEVIRFLMMSRSFRHLSIGAGLYAFVGYSAVTWTPAFLIRVHGMSTGEVGTVLALIIGVGGGIGNYLGGRFADRWSVSNPRGRMLVPTLAMFSSVVFAPLYLVEDTRLVLGLFCVPAFLGFMYQAPAFAVTQSLATPKMRATAAAVLLFVINIIGLGLGPLATGVLSDALEPRYGVQSLSYALFFVHLVYLWSGVHFWLASRTLPEDLAAVGRAARRESRGESTILADGTR
jgi:predicted MFS family arabinose efflux permease